MQPFDFYRNPRRVDRGDLIYELTLWQVFKISEQAWWFALDGRAPDNARQLLSTYEQQRALMGWEGPKPFMPLNRTYLVGKQARDGSAGFFVTLNLQRHNLTAKEARRFTASYPALLTHVRPHASYQLHFESAFEPQSEEVRIAGVDFYSNALGGVTHVGFYASSSEHDDSQGSPSWRTSWLYETSNPHGDEQLTILTTHTHNCPLPIAIEHPTRS